jgi:flagellar biosynthetic protein FlhB
MAENDQEKTEAPTPRRREEERRDGNVAKSQDLNAACLLLAGMILLNYFGGRLMTGIKHVVEVMLAGQLNTHPVRATEMDNLFAFGGYMTLSSMAPFVTGLFIIALLVGIGQVGFLLSGKAVTPQFSRINPISGVKNLVGMRGFVRLLMSLAKVAVIAGVAFYIIAADLPMILSLIEMDVRPAMIGAWHLLFWLGVKLALLLFVLAVLDYAYQRWQREQDMKMTKEQIKQEMKQMDGDPLVKQRRTRVARQLAMQRLGQAVPQADVIVTNPTHYAIALKYDSETMVAPKVIAKGADFMALRIRQLAMINEVPLVERKSLARALYSSVDVGQEIPPQHFAAVAEILAYVYRLSGRRSA